MSPQAPETASAPKLRKDLSALEVQKLHAAILSRLTDSDFPSLPQVAVRVLELISDENSSIKEFGEVISADEALTGRLLRLANSASMGQRARVASIDRAMVLIGLERLKALVLGFHLSATASDDPESKAHWRQSLFRACLAARLADTVDPRKSGEAFIVGLLLDVGVPFMRRTYGEPYRKLENNAINEANRHFIESKALPMSHVDAAAAISAYWRLPEAVAAPVISHHIRPDVVISQSPDSLMNAVAYVVGQVDLSESEEVEPAGRIARYVTSAFEIRVAELDQILQEAATDLRDIREIFEHLEVTDAEVNTLVRRAHEQLAAAAESMILQNLQGEQARKKQRVAIGGFEMELQAGPGASATATILSGAGAEPIASETITPAMLDPDTIREILAIPAAPDDEVAELIERLRALAAAA